LACLTRFSLEDYPCELRERCLRPAKLFLLGAEIQWECRAFYFKNMRKIIFVVLVICVLVAGWVVWQSRLAPENGLPPENGRIDGERTREIFLYYYNPDNDKDEAQNLMCSPAGLVAVKREIAITQTPIQGAIHLLLKGKLSADEAAAGITTEFPLAGLELKGANLANGVLTLDFNDPRNMTGGGSCRVGILRAQIEATAKQFAGVNEVRVIPEELFQP